ncbi:MAG TPA: aminoglycoside adenylyltransferase domain-containing protein [Ktedonobacterales bacterium]
MDVPPVVAALLDELLAGVRAALGDNLVGVYLRGSLALGDFDLATSDVDFFTCTEQPISDDEFTALAALHIRLSASDNPYGDQLEGTYVGRAAAWRYEPGRRFPSIGRGETLTLSEHGANWVLERWVVREHGVALLGPDSHVLIAPVTPEDIRAAARDRLTDWAEFARATDDPDWHTHRGQKAYVVETMCRALFTLRTGELSGKPQAVAWALTVLPEPWRGLIARSRAWRCDPTPDDALNAEVQRFALWVAEEASGN